MPKRRRQTRSHKVNVPTEILDLIIKELVATTSRYYSPTNDLKTLCLVSKVFLSLSRCYLVKEVELDYDHEKGIGNVRRRRLERLLKDDLQLARHVKKVVFRITDFNELLGLEKSTTDAGKTSSALPECLSNVDSLHIIHNPPDDQLNSSNGIRACRIILRMFNAYHHQITSLHVTRLVIDLEDILKLPSLQHVSSENCSWVSKVDDGSQGNHVHYAAIGVLSMQHQTIPIPPRFSPKSITVRDCDNLPLSMIPFLYDLESIQCFLREFTGIYWDVAVNQIRTPGSNSHGAQVSYSRLRSVEGNDTTPHLLKALSRNAKITNVPAFPALHNLSLDFQEHIPHVTTWAKPLIYELFEHMPSLRILRFNGFSPELRLKTCIKNCANSLQELHLLLHDFVFDEGIQSAHSADVVINLADGLQRASAIGLQSFKLLVLEFEEGLSKGVHEKWKNMTRKAFQKADAVLAALSEKVDSNAGYGSFRELRLCVEKFDDDETWDGKLRKGWEREYWAECFPKLHSSFEARFVSTPFETTYTLVRKVE
ncbi:hypothetical protein CVT24_012753 [Panaeolus cyanescens]|uniref:F-box domain-containing protein n=1 Tax=Panaeolus cyanescens TaxID=181874 RepID=A0A409YKW8_9AGAR|nr:hypothetical protein CVT24_012753 [Panaeolus cyanescens]